MSLELNKFKEEVKVNIQGLKKNKELKERSLEWLKESLDNKYTYNFTWLGRPIIQYPQDIIAVQELIWNIKPDLIIETGIAHGGSLILSASILALIEISELNNKDKNDNESKVIGIDIDIRKHNRSMIENHPLSYKIQMLEGSSTSDEIASKVYEISKMYKRVMVILDSNHTFEHVYKELTLYAPLVTKDSYCIVFDTIVNDLPKNKFPQRDWGPDNNPKKAVHKFLKDNDQFEIDLDIESKLMITVAPDGYLKKIYE